MVTTNFPHSKAVVPSATECHIADFEYSAQDLSININGLEIIFVNEESSN
jgi:hypothetical protein